jgi:hypothetical protein
VRLSYKKDVQKLFRKRNHFLTLPRLESQGFLLEQATLARVKGSTTSRGSKILDRSGLDFAVPSGQRAGAEVAGSIHLPIDECAAARAGVHPSPRRMLRNSTTEAASACGVSGALRRIFGKKTASD